MEIDKRKSRNVTLEEALEMLCSTNKITLSDKEIIRLHEEDNDLIIVQTEDYYDWDKCSGRYRHLVSERNFCKSIVSYLNEVLDIAMVDVDKLAKVSKTYAISGELQNKTRDGSTTFAAPNLKELGICAMLAEGDEIKLAPYGLKSSGRAIEFYGFTDQGARDAGLATGPIFNQKSVVANLGGVKEISIVYRMTFSGRKLIGSRLYLFTEQGRQTLDRSKNEKLMDFMKALDYWHDNKLKETSCEVVDETRVASQTNHIETKLNKSARKIIPGYA